MKKKYALYEENYFHLFNNRAVTPSYFLGLPSFTPPISDSTLFNPLSYLFGSIYYLYKGIWRKALILLALNTPTIFQPLPIILPLTTPLEIISSICLVVGCFILCMMIFLQYTEVIIGLIILLLPIFIYYCFFSINQHISIIATISFWSTLTSLFIFFLLRKKNKQLVLILLIGIIGWMAGISPQTLLWSFFTVLPYTLAGIMSKYDVYRSKVLHETFYW